MKKIFKSFILVYLLVFFAGLSNVLADECTDCWEKKGKTRCGECGYSCSTNDEGVCVNKDSRGSGVCTYEKDLTITFDDVGSPTINESFWPEDDKLGFLYVSEVADQIEKIPPSLQSQIGDLSGLCPSRIYYCKVRTIDFDIFEGTIEDFRKEIESDLTLKSVLSVLMPGIRDSKEVHLAATEEDLKKHFLTLGKDPETGVTEGIGLQLITTIMKAYEGSSTIPATAESIIGTLLDSSIVGVALSGLGPLGPLVGLATQLDYHWQECGYLAYTGTGPTYNLACSDSAEYIKKYGEIIAKFDECNEDASCKSNKLNQLKIEEEKAKKYCSNILENYDYDKNIEGAPGIEGDCIDQCLNIAKLMNTMKDNAGINKGNIGSCGFSARLLSWGRNIIKWVKYIIPVILIVLGILDFIRAVTKDKEEEMKKAQDRFVKRLIAAALIFIIPFILGFVLDKMGFGDYIDGCNVIEELNNY